MLVVRNNKIFLLWELTSIFMQTMWEKFLLFWHQHGGNAINLLEKNKRAKISILTKG